jgi:hypothetical protein
MEGPLDFLDRDTVIGDEDAAPVTYYGVVTAGRPLARAVWTASLELAEDMLANDPRDDVGELWQATLLHRSKKS